MPHENRPWKTEHTYRAPFTTSERRAYFAAMAENEIGKVVRVRAKRNADNLPTLWDDRHVKERKVLTAKQRVRRNSRKFRNTIRSGYGYWDLPV